MLRNRTGAGFIRGLARSAPATGADRSPSEDALDVEEHFAQGGRNRCAVERAGVSSAFLQRFFDGDDPFDRARWDQSVLPESSAIRSRTR